MCFKPFEGIRSICILGSMAFALKTDAALLSHLKAILPHELRRIMLTAPMVPSIFMLAEFAHVARLMLAQTHNSIYRTLLLTSHLYRQRYDLAAADQGDASHDNFPVDAGTADAVAQLFLLGTQTITTLLTNRQSVRAHRHACAVFRRIWTAAAPRCAASKTCLLLAVAAMLNLIECMTTLDRAVPLAYREWITDHGKDTCAWGRILEYTEKGVPPGVVPMLFEGERWSEVWDPIHDINHAPLF